MLKSKKKLILILIAVSAFLGFLDAAYLTIHYYKGVLPSCSLKIGCEKVLTSQYAAINGIPIALLGTGFYLAIIVLSILILQNPKSIRIPFKLLLTLILSGFVVSLILLIVQAFILHSFCQYCLLSEGISTLLLIFSVVLIRSKKN